MRLGMIKTRGGKPQMMRSLHSLLLLVLCVLAVGCKGYTDHEKEVYFMDAHEVMSSFGIVLVHQNPARRELIDDGREALGKLEWFHRKYVETPVDKEYGFIADLDRCADYCNEYIGIQQMRILEGKEDSPSAESDETAKKLEEAKSAVLHKLLDSGYKGFDR